MMMRGSGRVMMVRCSSRVGVDDEGHLKGAWDVVWCTVQCGVQSDVI